MRMIIVTLTAGFNGAFSLLLYEKFVNMRTNTDLYWKLHVGN